MLPLDHWRPLRNLFDRRVIAVLYSRLIMRSLRNVGVRGRLLFAFLGISAFAVLGAVAALLAFAEAERVFDRITRERLPAVFGALELSRQAEVIASAAPRLLASTAADQQMRTDQKIRLELAELER